MNDDNKPAPVIVIFGITGDLSKRKLMPALYHMLMSDILPEDTKIVGTSRKEVIKEDFIESVEKSIRDQEKVSDSLGLRRLENSLSFVQVDPDQQSDFSKLKETLNKFDGESRRNRLFYMSIPSSAFGPIISGLAAHDLNDGYSRLLIEKPFGDDMASAEKLIALLSDSFSEDQIYRIDHYLAKETAQNLLTFRLHNPIFKPLWNSDHIKSIRVRAFETLGVEGRGNFYEQTGAVRDFIQSHLMQLLSLAMLELPAELTSDSLHEAKKEFLEGINSADPRDAERGQYEGYKEEVGNENSFVETYASIELTHNSEKWNDTSIILETGKNMSAKDTTITIDFKTPHERRRNSLTFQIQPNEGISLDLIVKEPGLEDNMRHAALDFSYTDTFKDYEAADAYERVLSDAIRGDKTLFASAGEVLETWRILDPIEKQWNENDDGLKIYPKGTKPE